jgi:hypothetical protein
MKTNPLDLSNHLRYVDYRKNGWTRIVYSDGVVWKLWRFDCVGIVHKVQVLSIRVKFYTQSLRVIWWPFTYEKCVENLANQLQRQTVK